MRFLGTCIMGLWETGPSPSVHTRAAGLTCMWGSFDEVWGLGSLLGLGLSRVLAGGAGAGLCHRGREKGLLLMLASKACCALTW